MTMTTMLLPTTASSIKSASRVERHARVGRDQYGGDGRETLATSESQTPPAMGAYASVVNAIAEAESFTLPNNPPEGVEVTDLPLYMHHQTPSTCPLSA